MNEQNINPEIKKQINKEGFEENVAVLIGKKEEMPQLQELLETEGRAADLGSYIKMHKEIALPKEYVGVEGIEKSTWIFKVINYKIRDREERALITLRYNR